MSSQQDGHITTEREKIYTVGGVVRSGLWLYATSFLNNACGFLYWLVISAIAGPGIVGIASAIAGFSLVITTLLNLGTIIGVRRFYGMAIVKGDRDTLSIYFWTQLSYLAIVYGTTSLVIFSLACMGLSVGGLSGLLLIFSSVYIIASIAQAAQSLVISMLKTEIIFVASIVGNILKFALGLYLVFKGYGWLGATIGYLSPLLAIYVASLTYALRGVSLKPMISIKALRDTINAGIAYWIPNILDTVGIHLGILTIFGMSGATETGLYYVTLAVANLVFMLSISMLNLLLPTLSGLKEGHKEITMNVLKVSSSITFPLAAFLTFYSWLPLSLLGKAYTERSFVLSVLLLGTLPITIANCVANYVYAYGMYRYVLLIGLATNVPRIILYGLLIPPYQSLGAALSFVVGSFSGFVASLMVARRVGFKIELLPVIASYLIPLAISGILYIVSIPWYLALPTTLLICVITYPRLGIIRKKDLRVWVI